MKLFTTIIVLITLYSFSVAKEISEKDFAIIDYSTQAEEAKKVLFSGEKRIIVKALLKKGEALGLHTEKIPFLVQVLSGEGELVLGDKERKISLEAGSVVTVESNVSHDVIAKSELTFIVIKFIGDK